jgi:hypothetical protein
VAPAIVARLSARSVRAVFISVPLRNEINEMLATRSENGIRLDQHSRVLSMLFAILNNWIVFMSFILDYDFPQSFYALLFNSRAPRTLLIKSLARKCFAKLSTKYLDKCRSTGWYRGLKADFCLVK